MERRRFIGAAGLAGILAAGAAPAVHAGQANRWRLASRFPKTMDLAHEGVQTFIRLVRELSGGRFEIALQTAEESAAAGGVMESVQRGSVECGHTSPGLYVGKDEAFALDHAIPFGMSARQMNAWLLHGNGLALLREFYKTHGIVNFPLGNTGAQGGGWYRKPPPRSPADLKGLKMRIGGLGGRVFERLGGKPSSESSGDTFSALQRGSLDAAEWGSPHDDLRLGLHDLCRHYAFPGWWKGSAQFSLYINQRAFDALSDENQSIIEAAAAAAHQDILARYDARNPDAIEQLVATGTRLATTPKSILDAAWKATRELHAELAENNPHWRKIHASYAAFQKDQAWSWGRGENGFNNYVQEQLAKTLVMPPMKKSAPAARR